MQYVSPPDSETSIELHGSFNNSGTCPWTTPYSSQFLMKCADGSLCDVEEEGMGCCVSQGGRSQCPEAYPNMCNGLCDGEHCCAVDCDLYGGERECTLEDECYLTYCNAYSDLKNAFCSGGTCSSSAHVSSCKNHWASN